MNKRFSLCLLLPFLLLACKTQEQIQREKMVDQISVQMVERQKLAAEDQLKMENFEQKILELNGKVEELGHKSQSKAEEASKQLQERMELIEQKMQAYQIQIEDGKKKIETLETKVASQEKYISKVLNTLNDISGKPKRSKRSGGKQLSDYDQALAWYKKNWLSKSKPLFEKLELDKKITGQKRARVLHNLGMITFYKKQNDEAMVYFSKLFTEFPRSNYNANGLVHLAKTFQRLGKNNQAKQTLNEMIKRFPKSKHAKAANDLLKKL